MLLPRLWQLILVAASVVFAVSPPSNFVTTQNGKFMVNGKPIRFVGTNAYWLPSLFTDADIDSTLGNMSTAGIKVVRLWGFNDVETIPDKGTWFQLIANGTTKVNDGPDGLQKLDTIMRIADKHKMYVLLSLTNNWNPRSNGTPSTARNTLSNDFGGMDAYVRNFGQGKHDQFYTDPKILATFTDYISHVVKRYANSPTLFAWELANDPRCSSSLPASPECTPQTITRWHSQIAQVVKSLDPNHLVSSGNQGFQCTGCPKLFPLTPPAPAPSPAPGRRRSARMTMREILEGRKAAFRKARAMQGRDSKAEAVQIRGRWVSPELRQVSTPTSSVDGSQGIDSEDILNIPQIGFSTFQLFTDQNVYSASRTAAPTFQDTVREGVDWINKQAAVGNTAGKPVLLGAFGLLTKANTPAFVPFNTSEPPFTGPSVLVAAPSTLGVTDTQRDDAYTQWFQAGLDSGVQGMLQYQWSQGDLTAMRGTSISPAVGGTTTGTIVPGTGVSPNDGYSIQGVGQTDAVNTIQQAAQKFAASV
jgi:mannan endo-1,4-beta-mannosidase